MSDIGSDPIRKFRIGGIAIRNFRIGSAGSRIGCRIFGSGSLAFFKKHDPYPIRKSEFFPDTRSEIFKLDRISEISDRVDEFSDRVFLHTPNSNRTLTITVIVTTIVIVTGTITKIMMMIIIINDKKIIIVIVITII